MDSTKFEIFLQTIRQGSVKKTAEKLNYTQSGMLYTINSLERELGVSLMTRSHTGVTLSSAGKTLLPYIENFIQSSQALEQAVAQMGDCYAGLINLAASPQLARNWLPVITREYAALHPDVDITIWEGIEKIPSWIESEKVSFAIVEKSMAGDLGWMLLEWVNVSVAMPADYPFPEGIPVSLEELVNYPVLLSTYNSRSSGNDLLTEWARNKNTAKKKEIVSTDGSLLLTMVSQGEGIAFLADIYRKGCPSGVKMLPLNIMPPIQRSIGIAYDRNRPLSPRDKAFIEFIQEKAEERSFV